VATSSLTVGRGIAPTPKAPSTSKMGKQSNTRLFEG